MDPTEATSNPLSDPSLDGVLEDSDFTDASFMELGFGDFNEEAFVVLDFEDFAELGGAGAGIMTAGEALLDDFLLAVMLGSSFGRAGSRTSTPDSEYLTEDLAFSD